MIVFYECFFSVFFFRVFFSVFILYWDLRLTDLIYYRIIKKKRTVRYKIDERFLKRFVGSISKWQVVDDVELMISVRSKMLKQEKEDRESVASFVKVGRLSLLLFKNQMELILSEI